MEKRIKAKHKKRIKGLSPVIATVLLITIVLVIALIVFLWVKSMTQEAVTKFGDTGKPLNIQLVCDQVDFEASYSPSTGLYISNPGNVPIFGMDLKAAGDGGHQTMDLRDNDNWPELGLNQGGIFSDEGLIFDSGINQIILIPILLGESESGRKTYVCDENQYGYQIMV